MGAPGKGLGGVAESGQLGHDAAGLDMVGIALEDMAGGEGGLLEVATIERGGRLEREAVVLPAAEGAGALSAPDHEQDQHEQDRDQHPPVQEADDPRDGWILNGRGVSHGLRINIRRRRL